MGKCTPDLESETVRDRLGRAMHAVIVIRTDTVYTTRSSSDIPADKRVVATGCRY